MESDIAPFAAMCADANVMRYFPELLSQQKAIEQIRGFQRHFAENGFTYFAVEELTSAEFLGFVGLKHQSFDSPYTPAIDIGWRLKKEAWGRGFATEAAKACLDFAFEDLQLDSVLSICPTINLASEAVMKRIGMEKAGTFQHPAIAADSPLNPCVAYLASTPRVTDGQAA
ncbi:hypothetical protein MFFC18_34800 [Mariniblastus fucicola]|uniref:N-acetyltransferase domain-containing protein n=2 Tax=Mariniblastus fucicola TaxID=980251 RepID=A0A5B9PDL6_9BACT|nr:hypothetical protein MFFC18_34800 [Mariniblastus fucicola]